MACFVFGSGASAATFSVGGSQLNNWAMEYEATQNKARDASYVAANNFLGFTSGVADTLSLEGVICLPDGGTRGQVAAVVSKHVRDYPEQWARPAYRLVRDALVKAFLCKK